MLISLNIEKIKAQLYILNCYMRRLPNGTTIVPSGRMASTPRIFSGLLCILRLVGADLEDGLG